MLSYIGKAGNYQTIPPTGLISRQQDFSQIPSKGVFTWCGCIAVKNASKPHPKKKTHEVLPQLCEQ